MNGGNQITGTCGSNTTSASSPRGKNSVFGVDRWVFVDAGYATDKAIKESLGVRVGDEVVRVLVLRGESEIPSGYLFAAIAHWDGIELTVYWPHLDEPEARRPCKRHPMFALSHMLGVDPTKAYYHGKDKELAADARFSGFKSVETEQ